MINIEDYKAYLYQNQNFIDLLKENNSLVIDRLQDILKVLGFVEMMVDASKKVEEELEVIFEVGFSYFHEQLEEIKVYYNRYFKKNYAIFKKYESLINYALYLNDLEEVLKEKSLINIKTTEAITNICEEIDDILSDNLDFSDEIYEKYNLILEENVTEHPLTTNEIFGLIVEELSL